MNELSDAVRVLRREVRRLEGAFWDVLQVLVISAAVSCVLLVAIAAWGRVDIAAWAPR